MKFYIIYIVFLVFIAGCKNDDRPDVSKLLKEKRIVRFDREMQTIDKEHPDVEGLQKKYGPYFKVYTSGVLQLGEQSDADFPVLFSLFLKDSILNEIMDTVAFRYKDMGRQERELSEAWAYYGWYFPDRIIPEVYTHVSGFNQSVIVDSAFVSVSLDNYLGEDCIFYSMLANPIPMYIRKKMTDQNIVKDVMTGWLSTEFPFYPKKNDLVSGMLYQGKICYLLSKVLPEYEKSRLFDFSKEQLEWCENNESQIWEFLIENDYLFSTQQTLIMKYLGESPFTSGMPTESPGRSVVWTGDKVVEAYVKKTNISPEELMKEQDYHKILRIAGYRP